MSEQPDARKLREIAECAASLPKAEIEGPVRICARQLGAGYIALADEVERLVEVGRKAESELIERSPCDQGCVTEDGCDDGQDPEQCSLCAVLRALAAVLPPKDGQ